MNDNCHIGYTSCGILPKTPSMFTLLTDRSCPRHTDKRMSLTWMAVSGLFLFHSSETHRALSRCEACRSQSLHRHRHSRRLRHPLELRSVDDTSLSYIADTMPSKGRLRILIYAVPIPAALLVDTSESKSLCHDQGSIIIPNFCETSDLQTLTSQGQLFAFFMKAPHLFAL